MTLSTPLSYHVLDSPDYEEIKDITMQGLGRHTREKVETAIDENGANGYAEAIYRFAVVEPVEETDEPIMNTAGPEISASEYSDEIGSITEAIETSMKEV